MNLPVHYDCCPVCDSSNIHPILSAKDFTVSEKNFEIWHCDSCTLRFTQNAPGIDVISDYYKSENYISHTDTSTGVINRIYQLVRRQTLKQKRKLICRVAGIREGNLLDVGSGTGAFVNEMTQSGW